MNIGLKTVKILVILLFSSSFLFLMKAQDKGVQYEVSLVSGVASNETLPFWIASNRYGAFPTTDFGALQMAVSNEVKLSEPFGIAYKVAATGAVAAENTLALNEAYVRVHYKKWAVEVGSANDALKWNGLSSSNGNIVKSLNARAYPGVTIKTTDFVSFPFAKKWLRFNASFGNYLLADERHIEGVRLHSKSFQLNYVINSKLNITTGLEHYAQWAGTSPTHGKQPNTFKDFVKVFLGSSGGDNALETDQINALGSSLGSYLLQFNYKGTAFDWNFYYSHLFEDRSGREMMNYRDGLYGFFVDLKKEKSIVNSLLVEFTYTKHASGSAPHYVDGQGVFHAASGQDNYFNNGIYQSGWTYFGRSIGSPYFTVKPTDEDGVTRGIIDGDNRFRAFNLGVNGYFKKIYYKAMLSHVTYFGWFGNEYEVTPTQFSSVLECTMPSSKIPFEITIGGGFDTGTYRPHTVGGFLKLTKKGFF